MRNRSTLRLQRLRLGTALTLIALLFAISIGSVKSLHQPQAVFAASSVVPTRETQPMPQTGDSADDPAVWIHPSEPDQSTIIGTNKQGGIAVYNLAGQQIQYLDNGKMKMNNVDLRYNFKVGGQSITLVTATNRYDNSLALYKIDPATRMLESIAARTIKPGYVPYGTCMYHGLNDTYYMFVTSSSPATSPTTVEQWELFDSGAGTVDARLVRSFTLNSSGEGCVADDELAQVYFSEEAVGIWRYGAEPGDSATPVLVDSLASATNLTADVEGLTLYYTSTQTGYLIVSSQGNSSYLIYRREGNNEYVGRFVIGAANGIDAVQGTDGIDVTNASLGSAFPQGVFIAQDDANDVGNPVENRQNFKLVPWESLAGAFGLTIDTSWNPRQVGAPAPSPTPTPSPSPSPSPTPSPSPSPSPTPPPDNTLVVSPEADARVEMVNPNTNFGNDITLRADGSNTAAVRSYLRFNVSDVTYAIQSAKLRLYATTSTANGPSIYTTSNSWDETTITWNTRPGYGSTALDDHGAIAANDWIEYDVTSAVTGNGLHSFVLASSSSDGLTLLSRESTAKPQLILTLGDPTYHIFVPLVYGAR